MYLPTQNDASDLSRSAPAPLRDAPRGRHRGTEHERTVEQLVQRAQAGDSEAFGLLYESYSDLVYRYIYRRVGNWATAEDLTSDTFMRVLRRIGIFTWQGRKFDAWLVTIARNLVTDHFKSSRYRHELTTGEILDTAELERSPEEWVLESLSHQALLEIVRELNPQQQQCITLRFLQELTVAETARVMDKSNGAVKSLMCRAVRTLAQLERAQCQEPGDADSTTPGRRSPAGAGRQVHRDGADRKSQPERLRHAEAAAF